MGANALGESLGAGKAVGCDSVETSLHIVNGGFGGLDEIDGIDATAIEAALTRTDPLGNLFARVFNQGAGPMPSFTD